MLAVFFLFLIVVQVLSQNGFKPSLTCYMKYDHEETKSQSSNTLLGYSYYQKEITHYATTEGELCSKVGCACFSYRSVCPNSSPGSNHFSQCTDEDRQNRVIKWHRGWASYDQCQQMRYHPETYLDLTCCYTDRCNDQPGKITKVVDSQLPIQHQQYPQQPYHQEHQHYQHHYLQHPQQTSTTSEKPQHQPYHQEPQHYQHHYVQHPEQTSTTTQKPTYQRRSRVHHPTTTPRVPETHKPSLVNDKGFLPSSSLSLNSFSNWMIIVTLILSLLAMQV